MTELEQTYQSLLVPGNGIQSLIVDFKCLQLIIPSKWEDNMF